MTFLYQVGHKTLIIQLSLLAVAQQRIELNRILMNTKFHAVCRQELIFCVHVV